MRDVFAPHHLITWVIIGLVAGAFASRVVCGGGLGCLTSTVVGLAGAIIGGVALRALGPAGGDVGGDVLSDTLVAFIGAVLLLAFVRLVTPRRSRTPRPR